MWGGQKPLGGLTPNFLVVDIRDVITCFKFGDDRFRCLASAEGQILPFPIDFDGRPYNTLTLPCERVMTITTLCYQMKQVVSWVNVVVKQPSWWRLKTAL